MAERLFGMEIEYGCTVRPSEPVQSIPTRDWPERFMSAARECLPHLPSMDGGGIFLANGARFYIDCSHPEMTTPECANPWDVVRYMQAGERMLMTVAGEMKRREPSLAEIFLFKTNVDHSGSGSTWGCHTSFMHRGDPQKFPEQIIPHLVSRIVYSGAGGLELVDGRLRFTLSPRVRFLERDVSSNSTSERGIFHTKDETLASEGYHRLHIICGESLCSETALWLNMGATALIVAMIEAGLHPGDAVTLIHPLNAMRHFTLDPTCRAVAQTISGRNLSAVQIQRHYLELAEMHRHAPFMPPWADQVCIEWRKMLERLEHGAPASVASMLDWSMKYCLYLDSADKRGLRPEQWHHAEMSTPGNDSNSNTRPAADAPTHSAPASVSRGILMVHQDLCEIDTRFGQLGGKGIFNALNGAGVLGHHFPGVDNIEHALANPPAIGRARLRSQCIQRFASRKHRYACGWCRVIDREELLIMDLSDPFTSEEKWQKVPAGFREVDDSLQGHFRLLLNRASAYHDAGNNEPAAQMLRDLEGFQPALEMSQNPEYLRLKAWIQSRRGFLDAIPALDELAQIQPLTFSLVNDYVCSYRYQGLVPPPAIETWIERGREFLIPEDISSAGAALPFLAHWGYYLLRHGRAAEALDTLHDACDPVRRQRAIPAAEARALADHGDACRALGQHSHAIALLDEAERLQTQHGYEGDRADFALTYRVKLEANPVRALELLGQVKTIQTRLRNVMGEARTLLLEARLLRNPLAAATIKTRLLNLRELRPALAECRRLAKILNHWDAWTSGATDPDGGKDFYWWL